MTSRYNVLAELVLAITRRRLIEFVKQPAAAPGGAAAVRVQYKEFDFFRKSNERFRACVDCLFAKSATDEDMRAETIYRFLCATNYNSSVIDESTVHLTSSDNGQIELFAVLGTLCNVNCCGLTSTRQDGIYSVFNKKAESSRTVSKDLAHKLLGIYDAPVDIPQHGLIKPVPGALRNRRLQRFNDTYMEEALDNIPEQIVSQARDMDAAEIMGLPSKDKIPDSNSAANLLPIKVVEEIEHGELELDPSKKLFPDEPVDDSPTTLSGPMVASSSSSSASSSSSSTSSSSSSIFAAAGIAGFGNTRRITRRSTQRRFMTYYVGTRRTRKNKTRRRK